MMARPIRAVEFHYPMIKFLIKFVKLVFGIVFRNSANKAIRVNV